MTEVPSFENHSSITSAYQMFTSCGSLQATSATNFSDSGLSGVRSMRYTFSSCAFTTIGLRGIDPSALTNLFHTLSRCNKLTTIYADTSWALPAGGLTVLQCFHSCPTSLAGGTGSMWATNKTTYTYFRIDVASTPGYVTVP